MTILQDTGEIPPEEMAEAAQDLESLGGYVRLLESQDDAQARLRELDRTSDLVNLALPAVARGFIPMTIHTEDDPPSTPPMYRATGLQRDPQWLGLNPDLPLVRGLDVHLFSGQDTNIPHLVTAIPDGADMKDDTDQKGDSPVIQALREMMQWHGGAMETDRD